MIFKEDNRYKQNFGRTEEYNAQPIKVVSLTNEIVTLTTTKYKEIKALQ